MTKVYAYKDYTLTIDDDGGRGIDYFVIRDNRIERDSMNGETTVRELIITIDELPQIKEIFKDVSKFVAEFYV
jgi:hypothetical protein